MSINFGKNLHFLRKIKGLKQEEVSENVGVGRTVWSDYERGRSEPNISTILRISEFFNIPIEWLFLDNVQLTGKVEALEKGVKSTGICTDNSTDNDAKTHILEEEMEVYKRSESTKNKDEVIRNQWKIIDTQNDLIESLKFSISILKEQVKGQKNGGN